jgi:hypothetical protein
MGNQSLQVLARQACGKIGIKILPRAAARSRLRFDSAAGPPSRRMAHKILLNYLPQYGDESTHFCVLQPAMRLPRLAPVGSLMTGYDAADGSSIGPRSFACGKQADADRLGRVEAGESNMGLGPRTP